MKHLFLAVCLLLCSGALTAQTLNIIPTPQHTEVGQGHFTFNANTRLAYKHKEAKEVAQYFAQKIQRTAGFPLRKGKMGAAGTITLEMDASIKGREAYQLTITSDRVVAKASTADGLFYAVQSLLQLLPPEVESQQQLPKVEAWQIPVAKIDDAPRFPYRGVMLDPCRHFLPVDAVKRQIDMLAAYKINYLHWHLTEDQGWRIEIKKYPRLTEVGSRRVEGDGSVHQGFYTQEQIREVVEYARQRHIQVVPELEIPGHELAAIAAYPELSCRGEATTPRNIWGVEDVVMCPGKERMFTFLQDVIDEMVQLFPGKYFHIGGDECPRGEWEKCDSCQARMKAQGYTREAQLQSYIIGRIEKYLRGKGKTIIGWDEILEGGNLDTTAIVMSWRGESGGITAAKAHHHVLMTPADQGCYFDYYQGDPMVEPPYFGGYYTLERIFSYDPVPAQLKGTDGEQYVLGIQANNWSEYIHTPARLEEGLYPRALALAEVGWSQMETRDAQSFVHRVDNDHALRLQAHHINFHIPRVEQPGGSCNHVVFTDRKMLELSTSRPLAIYYTLDGTKPTEKSTRYTGPITLTQTTLVKAVAQLPCGILGPVRTILVEKEDWHPATRSAVVEKGLRLTLNWGRFDTPYRLPETSDLPPTVVPAIESLRTLTDVPRNVRNVRDYAATVEGYVNMPEKAIYEFNTQNHLVWIDNKLVIDNGTQAVPRISTNNAQIALDKGMHSIRVTFLGGIYNGWPTYWDDAKLKYRVVGTKDWQEVKPEMLFH